MTLQVMRYTARRKRGVRNRIYTGINIVGSERKSGKRGGERERNERRRSRKGPEGDTRRRLLRGGREGI